MRPTRSLRWVLAAALAVSFTTIALGEDFKIKLNRISKVGDEMTAHITTKFKQVISLNPNGPEEFTVDLRGTIKILAVNEKIGSATKLSCTVTKLTKNDKELYPPGTVIVGEKINKADQFTIDGNPVDAGNVSALSAVLDLSAADREITDDQMYGTDNPQPIGASWPINPEKIASEFAAEGLPVPAESLKGEVKLVDVKKVNDIDAMVMSTHITADGFKAAMPGATIADGQLELTAESVVPVDESLQGLSLKFKQHMAMTITPQAGGAATVTIDRETTQEQEPVKK